MANRSSLYAAMIAGLLAGFARDPAAAQAPVPAACPATPIQVVRSRGGVIDTLGSVPLVPDLCRSVRAGQAGDYYYGIWRSDWPGAGDAYPAIKSVILGGQNAHASFITRSVPGWQWTDSFVNEGLESMDVDGHPHLTLRIMHERSGIEGNTYHSRITTWRDVTTGVALRTYEQQISGQSYGPDTTWQAVKIVPLAVGTAPTG